MPKPYLLHWVFIRHGSLTAREWFFIGIFFSLLTPFGYLFPYFGCIVGITALLLFIQAFRTRHRQSTFRRLREEQGDEPWLWDFRWDRRGISDRRLSSLRVFLCELVGVSVLVMMMSHYIRRACPGALGWLAVLALSAAALAIILWDSNMLAYLKYGRSRLIFQDFPFLSGQDQTVRLINSEGVRGAQCMVVTLRCIEESADSFGRELETAHLYSKTWAIPLEGKGWSGTPLEIRIRIPADAPSTLLHCRPPTYWELEIRSDAPGVDYHASFLLPIYTRN